MPCLFRRLRRWRRPPAPESSPLSGLGDPPAQITGAEDAELDALRGELVRELDRMAYGHDGSAAFRRC